jgi:hypothetical protein
MDHPPSKWEGSSSFGYRRSHRMHGCTAAICMLSFRTLFSDIDQCKRKSDLTSLHMSIPIFLCRMNGCTQMYSSIQTSFFWHWPMHAKKSGRVSHEEKVGRRRILLSRRLNLKLGNRAMKHQSIGAPAVFTCDIEEFDQWQFHQNERNFNSVKGGREIGRLFPDWRAQQSAVSENGKKSNPPPHAHTGHVCCVRFFLSRLLSSTCWTCSHCCRYAAKNCPWEEVAMGCCLDKKSVFALHTSTAGSEGHTL